LSSRPYLGVIHDSRFYTIQALSALLPGHFNDDLYFRYGSADQFTLFTLAYKPALAAFGIAKSALMLTIVGQCLWISGLLFLSYSIFWEGRTALIAVTMAVALPGGALFNYGEQFLTPRLFAEGITLWALGSMLRNRPVRALILLGISATIHPIMTLPGLAALFLYQVWARRAWRVLTALAALGLLGVAFAGIEPFARLHESFDPEWFTTVRVRDFFCLLTQWTAFDWLKTANVFVLAALGLSVAQPRQRHFLIVLLAVALGGLAVTLIGGDFLHNVLLVDAQQYRAIWPLAVVANLFVGALFLRICVDIPRSVAGAALIFALSMLIISNFIRAAALVAIPMVAVAALTFFWEQTRAHSQHARLCLAICVGMLCGTALYFLFCYMIWLDHWPNLFWQTTRGLGLTAAALIGIVVMLARGSTQWAASRVNIVFAASLLTIAVLGWDQRSPWTKFVETTDVASDSLASLLPEQKSIYWEGDVRMPWFVLKQPSYFSCAQGTGALFFRGTAVTYQHRYDVLRQFRMLDFGQETSCPPTQESVQLTHEKLASICLHEPDLGALVLTKPLPDVPTREWVSPVRFEDEFRPFETSATDRFFVYSCDAVSLSRAQGD